MKVKTQKLGKPKFEDREEIIKSIKAFIARDEWDNPNWCDTMRFLRNNCIITEGGAA